MDDDLPRVYNTPLPLSDDSTLSVDTLEGLVRLVIRDAQGDQAGGFYFAPSEVKHLARNLSAAIKSTHDAHREWDELDG